MRLVATEYISLDGVFEEPGQWSFPFFNEEASQVKWATVTDTGEFGVRMNEIANYDVSSALEDPPWTGSRLIRSDVVAEIAALRRVSGRDLLLSGSAQLFNALLRDNLTDRYRPVVHLIVVGTGTTALRGRSRRPDPRADRDPAVRHGSTVLEYIRPRSPERTVPDGSTKACLAGLADERGGRS